MKKLRMPPEFILNRDDEKCIRCRVCERQCSFEVHSYDKECDRMLEDNDKCVGCHRCETLCPTNAILIKKNSDG